jgi:hypothetical protein
MKKNSMPIHLTKLAGKFGLLWFVSIRIVVLFIMTPYTLLYEYQRLETFRASTSSVTLSVNNRRHCIEVKDPF